MKFSLLAASLFALTACVQAQAKNELADALRQRLGTAEAVAMAKHNSGAAVEDRARERVVIDAAVAMARRMHVDPELTKRVFTAQIEANKMAQTALLSRWRGEPKFSTVPDLKRTVRPLLDSLTTRILVGLKKRQSWTAKDYAKLPGSRRDWVYGPAWSKATEPFKSWRRWGQ